MTRCMDTLATYYIHMKPVQIMMDPKLLADLDATAEVRAEGRSAVVRRAVAEYLARRRATEIRERYREAYGTEGGPGPDDALEPTAALDADLEGWSEEGSWPAE
jgi:ribbon-helix-helix CopG family protein